MRMVRRSVDVPTVLESLGFTIAFIAEGLDTSDQDRQDFSFISVENLV